jgi:nifR3 family TIM-barrel protein
MENNFWQKLPKPFFVAAPLANVTDFPFRQHLLQYSKPDVLWTEFVSADGLCHPEGRKVLVKDLTLGANEQPIVAQLFTATPEKMKEAAHLVATLGFAGVDINMGCPDKNVMKQGAGASCIQHAGNARALIRAAKEGVAESGRNIPVSVKTRTGFHTDSLETWLPELLAEDPAAITLHARTKKEMSSVPAHWERVKAAVEIRDALEKQTLIIGNGDVTNMAEARQRIAETGCDGVMFGRALLGNPWLFDEQKVSVTVAEKIEAAISHTEKFLEFWNTPVSSSDERGEKGQTKNFELMKKFYRAYINNFPLAKELRAEMMEKKSFEEIKKVVEQFKKEHPEILEEESETSYLL